MHRVRRGGAVVLSALIVSGCADPQAGDPTSDGPAIEETIPREATFTQGLELLDDGTMVHSRGRYGESGIDLLSTTGEVLLSRELPDDEFGEGVSVVDRGADAAGAVGGGPTAYQLTWKSGIVHTWSVPDLIEGPQLRIEGEGWGICYDETRDVIWQSDGTSTLRSRAVRDLAPLGQVTVTAPENDGAEVGLLNELECVDGRVWANVWKSDIVVQIDPDTGVVMSTVDLSGVVAAEQPAAPEDVVNGLAYDQEQDTFLVTGKNWTQLYRVDLER
ncbi:MAG: glutaminyl-peptide cyclotransferase [Ornithinimicrobium sp.]